MMRYKLAKSFDVFADDCIDSSPLYEFLSRKIKKDDDLLELCSYVQQGQPAPNMLLGAVHHLLLNGKSHPLAAYYESIVEDVEEVDGAFLPFKQFCHTYREEIIQLLQTKLVQTNEVRRTAYLYPSFSYIHSRTKKPLALVEIGTSAGFQLLWDQYCYSYGTGDRHGNLNACSGFVTN